MSHRCVSCGFEASSRSALVDHAAAFNHSIASATGGARLEIVREDGSREVSQFGVPPVTREELIDIAKEAQARVDELLAMLRDAKAERDEARESVTNLLSRVHNMHTDQRDLSAALRRVGCQAQGSCGESELDGLCFVCSALENCGSAS
jgi:hypothetical protein